MYTTMVTNDGGGLLSLFSINWSGNLSITLQGKVDNNGSGEIPEPTLTIAPGAQLAGVDSMGGHSSPLTWRLFDRLDQELTATVIRRQLLRRRRWHRDERHHVGHLRRHHQPSVALDGLDAITEFVQIMGTGALQP